MHNKFLALVRNIKVKCTFDEPSLFDIQAVASAKKVINKSKLRSLVVDDSGYIYKKSVDARDKNCIFLVYTVAFELKSNVSFKTSGVDVLETTDAELLFKTKKKLTASPVVVGFGPAGMFCALALAKAGLKPIVLERGDDVDTRAAAVEKYWKTGELDSSSNVQFGEGGAGTFSDGKLLTRISDKLCNYVLSQFTKFGAPDEIMYLSKPHIGTDNLRKVVKNIRQEIIRLGGVVRFRSCLDSIISNNGVVSSVRLTDGETIECSSLFLCIGHSARDTVKSIISCGVNVEPKPFSVGVRIEHLQKDINEALYGNYAGAKCLGPAQYTLSRKDGNRAVYSFCMCPGGVVVASASDRGQIVTNGMSYYSRDGLNANSAIAVSVDTSDYGNTIDGAIEFQENIERKAYSVAGNNGAAPIQLLNDFLNDKSVHEPTRIIPTYTGDTELRRASDVFPSFVINSLKNGILMFERDISGFTVGDAVLTFPETRTSSPVKIPRGNDYRAIGYRNLYPCGEGAGYAGGITSAAVDGLRAALAYFEL
ncbi:MAG: hypothetical protein E7600_05765 [Ruminococcaceae bacterium]|nr:hypothetical protein [Oscillospiraceae bacterium]